jgi:flagellar hook-associated protein 1 FlgK
MGISSALSTALSGLKLAQNGLDLVAQNVSSANVPGYTRKILEPVPQIGGGNVIGVNTESVTRVLDTLLQKQLRTETAGGQFTSIQTSFQNRLDGLYGPPGSASALDSVFNDFTSSLQDLVATPESPQTQSAALQKAQVLVDRINGVSKDIQGMRGEAEQGISDGVAQANDLLNQLQPINQQIVSASGGSAQPVNLLDQRDQILNNLSKLMDIRVATKQDGSVTVSTASGTVLFDRVPSKLNFDARTDIAPQSVYSSDPSKRSVGTITLTAPGGFTVDLIAQNSIKSGSIASYISLRDDVLLKAQANLDELASSMALALSAQTQSSTAVSSGGLNGRQIDVANLKPGDSITIDVTSGGVARTVTIVRVDNPNQLPISASQAGGTTGEVHGVSFVNPAAAAASIQSILGPGFTVANPSGTLLNVLNGGGAGTTQVTNVSGRITATALSSGQAALPFFTDSGSAPPIYSANFETGVQKIGFASRIAVNPALLSDPTRLVNMGLGAFNAGDPTRPQAILNTLTTSLVNFAPSAGLNSGPVQDTVVSYLQRIINNVGQNAATAKQLNDGQTTVVNGLQDRFDQSSKVSVDDEMARLITLQQTYQASARVLTIANSMLQSLMQSVPA